MKQPGGYKTRQKEQIMQYLTAHSGQHITAQALEHHLAENGTRVGTATIYRFLEQLVSDGVLRKYTIDARTGACYEYVPQPEACRQHFHLKCMRCETLYHVTCAQLDELEAHILAHHGFAVDQSKTVLYGICAKCREGQS